MKLVWISVIGLLFVAQGCDLDPVYTHCVSGSDCDAHQVCYEVIVPGATAGAMCTEYCDFDDDCHSNLGFAATCMVPDTTGGGICFQQCEDDLDCFSTSACWEYTDVNGFTDWVCLPEIL